VERGLLGEVVGRAVDPQAAGVDVGLAGAAERGDDGIGDGAVELRRVPSPGAAVWIAASTPRGAE
jgi:hypothetical protein